MAGWELMVDVNCRTEIPQFGRRAGLCALAVLCVAASGAAFSEDDGRLPFRVYEIGPSPSHRHDCFARADISNQTPHTLTGLAFELVFLDGAGRSVGRKLLETTDLRPGVRRRLAFGFSFAAPQVRELPQATVFALGICAIPAGVAVRLRACETRQGSVFENCLAALVEDPLTDLAIHIDPNVIAEEVEYSTVVPRPAPRVAEAKLTQFEDLGMTLSSITEALEADHQLSAAADGLLIVDVAAQSRAAQAGLRPGDVIVEMDQVPTRHPGDARSQLALARSVARKSVLLLLDRSGKELFSVVVID